mmetsp:Transcript_132359/g.423550  ORF Transcript_132359/g.423550 Transcript_132359/m.423550 type:complete len:259 (-) Transcript_132359:1102-1878(-)
MDRSHPCQSLLEALTHSLPLPEAPVQAAEAQELACAAVAGHRHCPKLRIQGLPKPGRGPGPPLLRGRPVATSDEGLAKHCAEFGGLFRGAHRQVMGRIHLRMSCREGLALRKRRIRTTQRTLHGRGVASLQRAAQAAGCSLDGLPHARRLATEAGFGSKGRLCSFSCHLLTALEARRAETAFGLAMHRALGTRGAAKCSQAIYVPALLAPTGELPAALQRMSPLCDWTEKSLQSDIRYVQLVAWSYCHQSAHLSTSSL